MVNFFFNYNVVNKDKVIITNSDNQQCRRFLISELQRQCGLDNETLTGAKIKWRNQPCRRNNGHNELALPYAFVIVVMTKQLELTKRKYQRRRHGRCWQIDSICASLPVTWKLPVPSPVSLCFVHIIVENQGLQQIVLSKIFVVSAFNRLMTLPPKFSCLRSCRIFRDVELISDEKTREASESQGNEMLFCFDKHSAFAVHSQ